MENLRDWLNGGAFVLLAATYMLIGDNISIPIILCFAGGIGCAYAGGRMDGFMQGYEENLGDFAKRYHKRVMEILDKSIKDGRNEKDEEI